MTHMGNAGLSHPRVPGEPARRGPQGTRNLPRLFSKVQKKWALPPPLFYFLFFFKILFIFLDRGEGREKEKERNISVWLPFVHPLLGTWLTTQACALTRNRTDDPSACSPALNPLSHTSQGCSPIFNSFPHTLPAGAWTPHPVFGESQREQFSAAPATPWAEPSPGVGGAEGLACQGRAGWAALSGTTACYLG